MNKKKDIGLVTFYQGNYGSILQCYAIKKFLFKCGYNCHVIYRTDTLKKIGFNRISKLLLHICRSIKYRGYFGHYMETRRSIRYEKSYLTARARKKQEEFIQEVLRPEGYNWRELKKIAADKNYIAFIAGSDQIWNANVYIDPIYFLQFAKKRKRIALAPSFGSANIPEFNKKTISKGLKGFTKISVREETGIDIVNKLSKVPVIRVADPVFLLTAKEWSQFGCSERIPNTSYIFVHFLNRPSKNSLLKIEKMADQNDAVLICYSYYYEEYQNLKKAVFIEGSPQEYVSLIENAMLICTDSFHSTVFSIIFHKPFFTFKRNHITKESQSPRITDMLTRYKLLNRYIRNADEMIDSNIDWNCIDVILKNERDILTAYIKKEVNDKIDESLCV